MRITFHRGSTLFGLPRLTLFITFDIVDMIAVDSGPHWVMWERAVAASRRLPVPQFGRRPRIIGTRNLRANHGSTPSCPSPTWSFSHELHEHLRFNCSLPQDLHLPCSLATEQSERSLQSNDCHLLALLLEAKGQQIETNREDTVTGDHRKIALLPLG